MIRKQNVIVWSFEQAYGWPYVGTNQQKETVKAKALELGGKAIDPRTYRRIK